MRTAQFLFVVLMLGGWGVLSPATVANEDSGQAQRPNNEDANAFGGLSKGPGQEEVFYTCSVCHSIMLVVQQRLTREDWDETLVWMVEEQGMPELEPAERELILDYLGTYLGRDVPR